MTTIRQQEHDLNVPAHLRATGFVIAGSQIGGLYPLPVRRGGPMGNLLIPAVPGQNPLGHMGPADKHQVYETEESALAAIESRLSTCVHDWRMRSHEEAECVRCHAMRLVPDVD